MHVREEETGHRRHTADGAPVPPAHGELSDRFAFGENWLRFAQTVDEERVREAERSLQDMLGRESLEGLTFLDVGSGSGLFSLAARRLGARCRSLDYDPSSVRCTTEIRRRFRPDDPDWIVERGDALDPDFMASLGTFDIVYSWGVLHHTGDMWRGLGNVLLPLKPGGQLFVALYNDQGRKSVWYKRVKRAYVEGPKLGRWAIGGSYVGFQVVRGAVRDALALRNPLKRYGAKKQKRGMSLIHDWIDWIGGYPFEVARPDEVVAFYRERGLRAERVETVDKGSGCNEFVFRRAAEPDAALPAQA